jgi:hypothetical protein
MDMTDEQRRWWFATHPEFSWSRTGSRFRQRLQSNTALANERLRRELGYPRLDEGLQDVTFDALEYLPQGRALSAPIQALKLLLRKMGRDDVISGIKKGGRRWKVGDDHLAPTPRGVEPAWSTQSKRYWKNRAAEEGAADQWGAESVGRMKKGQAPQRPNPKTGGPESRELHHTPIPRREGGKDFTDLWPNEHAAVDPHRRLKKE